MTNEQELELISKFADECGYYELDPKAALSFLELYMVACKINKLSLRRAAELIAFINSCEDPAKALALLIAQDWEEDRDLAFTFAA